MLILNVVVFCAACMLTLYAGWKLDNGWEERFMRAFGKYGTFMPLEL